MRISDWSSDVCSSDLMRSPWGGWVRPAMQPSRRRHAKNMLHCNILPIDLVYHRPYIEFSRWTRCSVNGYAEKGTAMFASATGNNSALQGSNFFGGVRHFFSDRKRTRLNSSH